MATTTPSQPRSPMSTPLISQPSVAMRPCVELDTSTSLTAGRRALVDELDGRQVDALVPAPKHLGSRAASSSSASDVRNPTRPKFTPITGTPVSRKRCSARSIVPSPPSTSTRSQQPDSSHGSASAADGGMLVALVGRQQQRAAGAPDAARRPRQRVAGADASPCVMTAQRRRPRAQAPTAARARAARVGGGSLEGGVMVGGDDREHVLVVAGGARMAGVDGAERHPAESQA